MNEQNIKKELLRKLYAAFYTPDIAVDLESEKHSHGWDNNIFEKVLDVMNSDGFIEQFTDVHHAITIKGLVYAENSDIVPREWVKKNKHARMTILNELENKYQKEGPHDSDMGYGHLSRITSLDEDLVLNSMRVLEALNYVVPFESNSVRITPKGRNKVFEWRSQKSIEGEFEKIMKMTPQSRGSALQKIFATIIENSGWMQDEGVRTSHEEMDVVVHKEREYYLIECKWENAPIEASVIRELHGKLSNRADVRGLVVSMSGFTKGSISQVMDYVSSRVILLFGAEDLTSMVKGDNSFEDLLNNKYRELITRKKIVFC